MTPAARRALAARGSALSERLTDAYEPVASEPAAERARERLERWRAAIDRGEPGRFERRLAWDGLDEAAVLEKLGEVRLRDGEPAPSWAEFFAEALLCKVPDGLLDPKDPLAFEEIAAPFVGAAWGRLAAARGAARLSGEAARRLRRGLCRSLSGLCAPALARELRIRRLAAVSGFDALFHDGAAPSKRLYAGLIEEATGPGCAEFWLARAALARALAVSSSRWVEALSEMLARLEQDAEGIARAFPVGPGDDVSELDFTASDPHDGGRRVGLFTFASGARVVYKPRGAELLTAWEGFLAELETLGAPDAWRRRGLFAPGPHAWLEFVPRAPCRDAAEASRYYRRAGQLLALMHVVQARDLHFENVVAAGDFPVPIDLEVILQGDARRPGADGPTAAGEAASLLDRSVFATGLLPIWPEDKDDFGALGAGAGRVEREARWKSLNTDEMAVEWTHAPREGENSRVVLDGRPVDAYAHREELIEGFRAGARFLARVAPEAQQGKAYRALLAAPVRALLRATSIYGRLLALALIPPAGADGVDRSLELESLAAAWTRDDASRELWPLCRAELKAMEDLDIPIIHARAEGSDAWSAGGEKAPLMLRTGREASLGAWNALDEHGIAFQEAIARAAMLGRVPVDAAAAASAPDEKSLPPFDAAAAAALAAEIAADAAARAARTPAGAAWIEPAYDSKMSHLKLTVLGPKLYDGTSGLALFLAARAPLAGGEDARALAREAAAPLLGLGETARRALVRAIGLGGGVGVGGALYALTRAGRFLGDEDFLDAARGLARSVDAPAVAAEREFDVMFGLAGAALSLLALHDADPRAEWLERAVLCGEGLLARRESWEGEGRTIHADSPPPRAWRGKDGGAPASGFSHGAAGAACALWRLAARAGDARFRDAAREAWAFDDSLFVPRTGYWRRTAADDGSSGAGWSSWCWGAPGAGLSRLEAAAAGEAPALAAVERSLSVVRALPPRAIDHVCCGEFGVAEFLLETGRALARPELVAEARARAAARLPQGPGLAFRLHPALPNGPTSPTFFGGTAGIGYALLRLADPERYPCVLTWR